jgi:cyclase
MLKVRVIPILTFNGFGLVKTKNFSTPRMVGNPVQAARVYNSRGVDELVFLDIFASEQKRKLNLKLISDVIKECYMPVAIGGGIQTIEDVNSLLKIGADKVIIKTKALTDKEFIKQAVSFFGSQCISIAVDVHSTPQGYKIFNKLGLDIGMEDFIHDMDKCEVGEFVVTSVDKEGLMQGFDVDLIKKVMGLTQSPVIAAGGCGNPEHCNSLLSETGIEAVAASSIFHFTQFTPNDIKESLSSQGFPIRFN